MRNFLRALRYAWSYQRALILSVTCAFIAAAFWGLNLTAIYPVLTILGNNKSMLDWVDGRIEETQKESDALYAKLAIEQARLKEVDLLPEGDLRDKMIHSGSAEVARVEGLADTVGTRLWHYQLAKRRVIRHLPTDRFETLVWLMALVVAGCAIKGFFEFWQEYLVGRVTNDGLYDLRNDFYRAAIRQDLRQTGSGSADLMSRFTTDLEIVGSGMKLLFGRVIAEPLRVFACLFIACWINWQLTATFLIMLPVAFVIMNKTSRMMKRATKRMLEQVSSIYRLLQETLQGLRVVKAFTMESYERRRFAAVTRDYRARSMRVVTIDALSGPIVELLGVMAVAAALLAGAYLICYPGTTHIFGVRMTSRTLEIETLLQLYALLAGMADPVRKLSSVFTKLQAASAASDRVFTFMDRTPSVGVNASGPRLERHSESIEFKNLCFAYQPGVPVLENVSFRVSAGETLAVVGPNGCGKSTLLNLLPRFYDADYGSILIDGIPIRQAHLRTLRRQIGLVTQDTVLFADTIRNNIAYGTRRAPLERIEEAAKQAFAHEFIMGLPQGYDTLIGEATRSLSGGERQRIALARAILRNPAILILDEFTSQIDAKSDALIHETLRNFRKGRTTFLITHKMHTVEIADRVLVLNAGKVEAIGTHAEVMQTSASYRGLVEAHPAVRKAA